MALFYDLHVSADDLEGKKELLERLGWSGVCFALDFSDAKDLRGLAEEIASLQGGLDVFLGVSLAPESSQKLQEAFRQVVEIVDFILVDGGDHNTNRFASEAWGVDILCHPEKSDGRDFMKQKNSGLDPATVKCMSEHGVAVEFDFSQLLNSSGMLRSQILGRMQQNVILARKYNALMILSSGAQDKWGLRAPRDLIAVGRILGMTYLEAKNAVSSNPLKLIEKSKKRRDPDIITEGLEVIDWGEQKPKRKKMFGWY